MNEQRRRETELGGEATMRHASVLAGLLLLTVPATAGDEGYCRQYAYNATNAADAAQNVGGALILGYMFSGGQLNYFGVLDPNMPLPANCGYSGPRWSQNYDDHYNWCRGASEATVNAEQAGRADELSYCGICVSYVNAASQVEARGRKALCPLRGTSWPSSGDGLLQFCLTQEHSDVQAALGWLQAKLKSGSDQIEACQDRRLNRKLNTKFDANLLKEHKFVRSTGGSASAGNDLAKPNNSPSSRALTPGLLEGDSGFSTSAPVVARGGSVSSSKVNVATPSVSVQTAPATSSSGLTGSKVHVGVPPAAPGPNIR